MQAKKPSRKDAAIQIRTDFAFYEASNGCSLLARIGQKGLEGLSDDFVEKCLLRLVALVARLIDDHVEPSAGPGRGARASVSDNRGE